MSKGAKPGQNRFAGVQKRNLDFRLARLKDEVVPKLKCFVGKTSFDGITPFSRFCAELYNDGLPVNEKKISYRTLVQSTDYWTLIGPIFYKHWDASDSIEAKKNKLVGTLAIRRADELRSQVERLNKEVNALRSALRNYGASPAPLPDAHHSDQAFMEKFDKTCRLLQLVLDGSDNMLTVDLEATKMSYAYNDLEPAEGIAPKDLVTPFVSWMKERRKTHGEH